jgi:four helix bundle protein
MSDFKKLHVWRKAHALALNAHRVARGIRGTEYASLRSQIIRAAMSIPANIVEGRGQKSAKEQSRFLRYAVNSTSELEYHLIAGRDFEVISKNDFASLLGQLTEVRKMTHGLLNYLSQH